MTFATILPEVLPQGCQRAQSEATVFTKGRGSQVLLSDEAQSETAHIVISYFQKVIIKERDREREKERAESERARQRESGAKNPDKF